MNNNFRWWSDVKMLRVICEAARYDGNPLLKLSNTMKWGISFGDNEITELEHYLEIIGPLVIQKILEQQLQRLLLKLILVTE